MEPANTLNGTISKHSHDAGTSNPSATKSDAASWVESELKSAAKFGSNALHQVEAVAHDQMDKATAHAKVYARQASSFVRKNPAVTIAAIALISYGITRLALSHRSND